MRSCFITLLLGLLVAGCSDDDRPGATGATVAPTRSSSVVPPSGTTAAPATSRTQVVVEVTPPAASARPVPVVFVHGRNANPLSEFEDTIRRLARGRRVVREVYAGDTLPADLPADSLLAFGYYRERRGTPEFYADRLPVLGSIGGCPVPRSDPGAGRFGISYAGQLDRLVEQVCQVTGARRVDLVAYSMGGLVTRAYTRWLSLKGPGGASRVRRLLTVCSPNEGITALEASFMTRFQANHRPEVADGEGVELNQDLLVHGGQSFVQRLNTGWDAFCQREGIVYASAYGYGQAPQHDLRVAVGLLGPLLQRFNGFLRPGGLDITDQLRQATGDGDGTVRLDSARLDPARYPHVAFNAPHHGTHDARLGQPLSNRESDWFAALVRRFVLEADTTPGFAVGAASLTTVDHPTEATWLALRVEVTSGVPLAAQVTARSTHGSVLWSDEALLHPGQQTFLFDPVGADGIVLVQARLFGLDGQVVLTEHLARLTRGSRPRVAAPWAVLGVPRPEGGSWLLPIASAADAPVLELSWALDAGRGAVWSAFQQVDALRLPPLIPGSYELRLRARDLNGVEGPHPDAIRLVVDGQGAITFSR